MAERAVILERRPTKVDVIDIDSCLDESHMLANTITDHPMEEGFNATDHSRPNPDMVNLRCFVSNTPLSTEQTTTSVRQGNVAFDTTAPQVIGNRGDDTFAKLKKIRDEGRIISVVTTLKTYAAKKTEGLMIESLNISRTRQNYDGLEFTLTLKQVRIVTNKSTRAKSPTDSRTQQKKGKGAQATKSPKDIDPFRTAVKAVF